MELQCETVSFAGKAKSAVVWNTAFNLFRDFLQFITMLILVRILRPESYGEFSLVSSVVGFLAVFSHNSFLSHTLQVKHEEEVHYQDHFTASAIIQGGLFVLTNVVAVALRWFPAYAPVAPYVHVMSVGFLLEWPCELRRKMLERNFDWKRLRLLQAVGLLAGAFLAPILAWVGAGTYSLLIPGLLVTLPFLYDLFFLVQWRPTWRWEWQNYRAAFFFGLSRLGSAIAGSGRGLMESALLSATLGFLTLGFFGRAVGLSNIFCQKFSTQLMYAIYPVLTRLSNGSGRTAQVSGLVLQVIAWTSIPIAVIFAGFAETFVHIMYGNKWDAVVPLLGGAMLWGVLNAISHACYMLLMSNNKVRSCLAIDFASFVGVAVILLVVLPFGLSAYIYGLCVMQTIIVAAELFALVTIDAMKFKGILTAFVPPAIASAAAWLAVFILQSFFGKIEQDYFQSFCWALACGLIYIILIRLIFLRQLNAMLVYFPARRAIARILLIREAA